MRHATLCVMIDEDSKKILLGMKKRGFGEGKFNGFGGKPELGEDITASAIREIEEEVGLKVTQEQINKVGELDFKFSAKPEWNQLVHLFVIKNWQGEPIESEEMKPEWFDFHEIPFEKMWNDDPHWLPLVLKGKKVSASFTFGEDNESIKEFKVDEI